MLRRLVSLILALAVLPTQAALVGHRHGRHDSAVHEASPHLHVALIAPAGHSHDHPHHHGHRHHDHDESDVESVEPMLTDASHRDDHDGDAVYLAAGVTAARVASASAPDSLSHVLDAALPERPARLAGPPGDVTAAWPQPPPGGAGPCPLYVRHLALLI